LILKTDHVNNTKNVWTYTSRCEDQIMVKFNNAQFNYLAKSNCAK
jgi:hypothetical protein